MVTTANQLTLDFAVAFGVYMIAGGLSGVLTPDRWTKVLEGFMENDALVYISGVFVFVLGAAMIMVHNIWSDTLSGFISLVGWVAAIEGLIIIIYPKPLMDFSASLVSRSVVKYFAIGVTALGLLVALMGLTGTVAA